jgi:hypothetical protein
MDVTIVIGLILNFTAVIVKSLLDILKQRSDSSKAIDLRPIVEDVKATLQLLRDHDRKADVATAKLEANIGKS